MNSKVSSSFAKISSLVATFLLTSCASVEQGLHSSLQAMEDSIRGYRVQYHTIPAGAKIVCSGSEIGEAPFAKFRDLTPEQKTSQLLQIDGCEAVWASGARAPIRAAIPLDQFPSYVHLVTERPLNAPGFEVDEAVGVKTLAARQKLLDDIAAMSGSLAALGTSIHEANKARKNTSAGVPMQCKRPAVPPVNAV